MVVKILQTPLIFNFILPFQRIQSNFSVKLESESSCIAIKSQIFVISDNHIYWANFYIEPNQIFVISDNHIYWANFYIEPNLFHVIDTIIIMEPKLDYINLGKGFSSNFWMTGVF